MSDDKRIAVIGTGANGAAVAADLARAGRNVTLIDQWPENVAAIRKNGIRVNLRGEAYTAHAPTYNICDVATLRETFDIILVMVKSYDTRWATWLVEPLLAPDGLAMGVQNGMTMDDIANIVGPERTLGCVIECGGAMWHPGLVERDTPHDKAWFAVGAYDKHTEDRVEEGVDVLRHSGRTEIYPDVRAAKWMKLVINAAEVAPSAILNLSLQDAIEMPGMREFMLNTGAEAISVLHAAGVDIVPIFGVSDLDPDEPREFVSRLLDQVIYQYAQPLSKVTALQDWMKGRRSEIDDMNGTIVRKGAELGHPTPFNSRALEIAMKMERLEIVPDISVKEMLLA
jgi:2-dehydropantoate 2-reductase